MNQVNSIKLLVLFRVLTYFVVYYGAGNSDNSCPFDVLFEILWWCVHIGILCESDFNDTNLWNSFRSDMHKSQNLTNNSRNHFSSAIWSFWADFRERFQYRQTKESHSTGTDRIGFTEVVHVTKDYILYPGSFGTILKTGCCLSRLDRRWCYKMHKSHHTKICDTLNNLSVSNSLKQDCKWESPVCCCGRNQERTLVFPEVLVLHVQKGN